MKIHGIDPQFCGYIRQILRYAESVSVWFLYASNATWKASKIPWGCGEEFEGHILYNDSVHD